MVISRKHRSNHDHLPGYYGNLWGVDTALYMYTTSSSADDSSQQEMLIMDIHYVQFTRSCQKTPDCYRNQINYQLYTKLPRADAVCSYGYMYTNFETGVAL